MEFVEVVKLIEEEFEEEKKKVLIRSESYPYASLIDEAFTQGGDAMYDILINRGFYHKFEFEELRNGC